MTIVYEFGIKAVCPIDDTVDDYEATISTNTQINCERINVAIREFERVTIFQEALTAELHRQLVTDGSVSTVGTHSGVRVTVTVES